ncbi:cation diffusion facilitator family transporter [Actinophytocola oryzae]|uniref:Cation diffusion facilitator family transporter n=1 Tax=Actinophytocola oryzae TaxID=502181 RepID=A0A4R7VY84_9PSEU|nr:cation diffusion facilitator family transporter [Actinophytocola oryzae]TDV55133.1 cation diffusion facilitator family transporter [Actinophytocola oryzae]
MAEQKSESTLTVLVALGANLAIAVLKLVAGVITGSAAMLAEAGHSIADTFTEGLLLTALRRSGKPADRAHPFGYGKERYFWSLMAAVSIFTSGALFAFYEGFRTIFGEDEEQTSPLIGYIVLGLAFVLEGISWLRAVRQVRAEAATEGRSVRRYLRLIDDPTVKTVFFEDSAALVGILLAFGGIALHDATGSAFWDGLASVLIGVLLAGVAYLLGRTNKGLLIGRQADSTIVQGARDLLASVPEVEVVVDLLTMVTGTDQVLLCARLDFAENLSSTELELACVRISAELRERFTDLDEIFLEPVPRTDPELRARVMARYGEI